MTWQEEKTACEKALKIGKYADAERIAEKALALAESVKDDRGRAQVALLLGRSNNKLADYKSAEKYLRIAVEVSAKEFSKDSIEYATAQIELGYALIGLENYEEAEREVVSATDICKAKSGVDSAELADSLTCLGVFQIADGKFPQAQVSLSRALGIRERKFGQASEEYAETLLYLGVLHLVKGADNSADVMIRRAVAIYDDLYGELYGEKHPALARAIHQHAMFNLKMGRNHRAIPEWERVISMFDASLPPNHPYIVEALNGLGSAQLNGRYMSDAAKSFQRALKEADREPKLRRGSVLTACLGLGMCYAQQLRNPEAEPLFERSKQLIKEAEKTHHQGQLIDYMFNCYLLQGKFDKAFSLVPDQMRHSHESRLGGYIGILNMITELGERHVWAKDDTEE